MRAINILFEWRSSCLLLTMRFMNIMPSSTYFSLLFLYFIYVIFMTFHWYFFHVDFCMVGSWDDNALNFYCMWYILKNKKTLQYKKSKTLHYEISSSTLVEFLYIFHYNIERLSNHFSIVSLNIFDIEKVQWLRYK